MTHEHTAAQETAPDYNDDTDPGTVLILKAPDDAVYVYWLMCEIASRDLSMAPA